VLRSDQQDNFTIHKQNYISIGCIAIGISLGEQGVVYLGIIGEKYIQGRVLKIFCHNSTYNISYLLRLKVYNPVIL